jgi:hypothetical protein
MAGLALYLKSTLIMAGSKGSKIRLPLRRYERDFQKELEKAPEEETEKTEEQQVHPDITVSRGKGPSRLDNEDEKPTEEKGPKLLHSPVSSVKNAEPQSLKLKTSIKKIFKQNSGRRNKAG